MDRGQGCFELKNAACTKLKSICDSDQRTAVLRAKPDNNSFGTA